MRPRGFLRHFIPNSQVNSSEFRPSLKIKRLLHIILRRMVNRALPLQRNALAVQLRINSLESFRQKHRGHALLHKRILIAAHEEHFFGHGIGTDFKIHVLGNIAQFVAKARVLHAVAHNIAEVVQQRDAIHIDIGNDLLDRHRGIAGEIV